LHDSFVDFAVQEQKATYCSAKTCLSLSETQLKPKYSYAIPATINQFLGRLLESL
jgi:hypothetical protein